MEKLISTSVPYYASGKNVAYFCNFRKKYIIDNYRSNNLPLVGWFKYCSFCDCVTSSKINFLHQKSKIVIIPACVYCIRREKRNRSLRESCIEILSDITFK